MKKLLLAAIFVFSTLSFTQMDVSAKSIDCPKPDDLEATSVKDKEAFLKALETLIPETYDDGGDYLKMYEEWEVKAAVPFPKAASDKKNEVYYEMAKDLCGKEVADKSGLAKLYFPRWEGKSASASEGQLFVAKSKEKGWFVWFRYH